MDAGNRHSEYQAYEGLSSVAFLQQKYDRSCEYLKDALTAASADSSEHSSATRQRIISKLTSVLSLSVQLQLHSQPTPQKPTVCLHEINI